MPPGWLWMPWRALWTTACRACPRRPHPRNAPWTEWSLRMSPIRFKNFINHKISIRRMLFSDWVQGFIRFDLVLFSPHCTSWDMRDEVFIPKSFFYIFSDHGTKGHCRVRVAAEERWKVDDSGIFWFCLILLAHLVITVWFGLDPFLCWIMQITFCHFRNKSASCSTSRDSRESTPISLREWSRRRRRSTWSTRTRSIAFSLNCVSFFYILYCILYH